MPNKFITNLDLARQAEIFSGETAVFKGGMQLGIPFSGFPTGVDTSTITSLGVVDTQFAVLSGNTGTTVFNVTDPSSPYYSVSAPVLSASPYTIIDEDSIVETISATTYPTIMSFTAVTGSNGATLGLSFSQPILEILNSSGQYTGLFSNLGGVSIGTTFSDESFYNVGSVFSGANLNMEVVTLGAHASTPAWSTGTTSGTVIEYSAMTQYWTDPTIINYTSGLTLPITPESAETQTSDYVWTLTDSEIIDENLIGLQYTGYSITYSFNNLDVDPTSPSLTGATGTTSADTYYFGTVVATYENFSAGTLDYKGSTNWMKIDGMSTVEERLTVGRMTINNPDTGTSVSTLGIDVDGKVVKYTAATSTAVTGLTFNDTTYDLTLGIDDGTTFTDSLAILASDIKVTGGTFNDTSGEMTFVNNSGGTFVVSGLSTDFTGNTSGTCITDLHITNLHSCSPLYINPLDEGNVYFGSTSGVTIDVANNRIGIGTQTPSSQLHIEGSGADIRVQSTDTSNAMLALDIQSTGGGTGFRNALIQFQEDSTTEWIIGMNGLAGGSEEDKQFVIANDGSFDTDYILNINPSNGYVGLGVQAPTERLDISGNIKLSGGLNIDTIGSGTSVTNLGVDASGNVVSGTTGGGSSLWTDDGGGKISYGDVGSSVNIYEDSFPNTYGAAVTIERGFLMVGSGNDIGHSVTSTNVSRSVVFGTANILGSEGDAGYNMISGNNNDILSGDYNGSIGQNNITKGDKNFSAGYLNLIYGNNNISLGDTNTIGTSGANVNKSVAIGEDVFVEANDQIVIGFGIDTNASYAATKGIFVGIENGKPNSGWFTDPAINSTANFALGGRDTMRTDIGVIKTGTGAGIFYLANYNNANVTEPSSNAPDAVAMYAKDRDTGKSGLKIKAEDGTNHFFSDFSSIGGDETIATANKTLTIAGTGIGSGTSSLITKDSGGNTTFEVKDDGTVVIPNVGSATPVTNLGVDASGNVVSGTTGGGGGGLNYISAGAVATNLETTSNWDINGVYTGATATGTQADCHVDSDYWFTCVATDTWIRLIRG